MMGLEPAPGEVRPGAVAQVATRREIEAQDAVSRAGEDEEHGLVRLRPRMGLHVDVGGAEQLNHLFDGEALDGIDMLTTAMERLPG